MSPLDLIGAAKQNSNDDFYTMKFSGPLSLLLQGLKKQRGAANKFVEHCVSSYITQSGCVLQSDGTLLNVNHAVLQFDETPLQVQVTDQVSSQGSEEPSQGSEEPVLPSISNNRKNSTL